MLFSEVIIGQILFPKRAQNSYLKGVRESRNCISFY